MSFKCILLVCWQTYVVQKVDDPFSDNVNMRIDVATVHFDLPISMQQMIW